MEEQPLIPPPERNRKNIRERFQATISFIPPHVWFWVLLLAVMLMGVGAGFLIIKSSGHTTPYIAQANRETDREVSDNKKKSGTTEITKNGSGNTEKSANKEKSGTKGKANHAKEQMKPAGPNAKGKTGSPGEGKPALDKSKKTAKASGTKKATMQKTTTTPCEMVCNYNCNLWNCFPPLVDRPFPEMIICDDANCTNEKCCNLFCDTYTCADTNLTLKDDLSSIICSNVTAGCDDATCCEPKTCDAFNCTAPSVYRFAPAMITCAATGCTNEKCCNLFCDSYTCANTNLTLKDDLSSIICSNVTAGCDDATCCEPKTCDTFTCNQTIHRRVSAPNMVICDTTGCTEDKCCQAQSCQLSGALPGSNYTCQNPNLMPRSSPGVIACSFYGCDDATCCEPKTCDTFNCTAPLVDRDFPEMITCDPATGCTNEKCCNLFCDTYTCADTNLTLKDDLSSIICRNVAAGCDDATCCEPKTCDTFNCTGPLVDRDFPAMITCAATGCTNEKCCNLFCDSYTCANTNLTLKDGLSSIICSNVTAGCDDATCCEPKTCDTFTCNQTIHRRVSAPNMVICDTTGCTEDKCCQAQSCQLSGALPGSNYTCQNPNLMPRSSPAVIACSFYGCDDATCCEPKTCDTFNCTAPLVDRDFPEMITCDPATGCTNEKCCNLFCDTYTCADTNLTLKDDLSSIICRNVAAGCDDATCCEPKTCDTFNCTGPLVDRDFPAMITCAATGCTNEKCCNLFCDSYTCANTNLTLKDGLSSIICSNVTAGCDDATCCEPKTCDTFTCNQTIHRRVSAPNMVICDTTGCTEDKCCQAQSCQLSGALPGSNYTCQNPNLMPRSSPAVIACSFYGCDDATCCEPKTCDTFNCTAPLVDRDFPEMITCDPATGCTNEKCCNLFCDTYTCADTNLTLKDDLSSIICRNVAAGCDDATCCEAKTCDTFNCTGPLVDRDFPAMITCAATGCTNEKCCNLFCDTYTCADTNLTLKDDLSSIICNVTTGCDDATCCEPKTCDTFNCTAPSVYRFAPAMITCDPATGCTHEQCCDLFCSTYTCADTNLTLKDDLPSIICNVMTGCDDATCCEPKTCDTYTCTAPSVYRFAPATITCDPATGCTNEKCCDQYCSTHACNCTDALCCELLCTTVPFDCTQNGTTPGLQLLPRAGNIRCGASCSTGVCCGPISCSSYNCGTLPKIAAPSTTVCDAAGCTSSRCCATCPTGYAPACVTVIPGASSVSLLTPVLNPPCAASNVYACVDVDECSGDSSPCPANQTCRNTAGSYVCRTLCNPPSPTLLGLNRNTAPNAVDLVRVSVAANCTQTLVADTAAAKPPVTFNDPSQNGLAYDRGSGDIYYGLNGGLYRVPFGTSQSLLVTALGFGTYYVDLVAAATIINGPTRRLYVYAGYLSSSNGSPDLLAYDLLTGDHYVLCKNFRKSGASVSYSGDIAWNPISKLLYVSGSQTTGSPVGFFLMSLDISMATPSNPTCTQSPAMDYTSAAAGLQIAFTDPDGQGGVQFYAIGSTPTGANLFRINPTTGATISTVCSNTRGFTDLAEGGTCLV
eukprot:g48576.t1